MAFYTINQPVWGTLISGNPDIIILSTAHIVPHRIYVPDDVAFGFAAINLGGAEFPQFGRLDSGGISMGPRFISLSDDLLVGGPGPPL